MKAFVGFTGEVGTLSDAVDELAAVAYLVRLIGGAQKADIDVSEGAAWLSKICADRLDDVAEVIGEIGGAA